MSTASTSPRTGSSSTGAPTTEPEAAARSMRIDVITLFPELFAAHLVHGVTRRAFEPGRVDVHLWPLRDFGDPPHARVDDRPYGGGPGMVLLLAPLAPAARLGRSAARPRRRPPIRRRSGHGAARRAPRARPGRDPRRACRARA